ncbi:MAG: TolC family protein [Opitutae bacterium]
MAVLCAITSYGFEVFPEERPENFFPDLKKSLQNVEANSSVIRAKEFDLAVAEANQLIAKSEQGWRIGINAYGQSIHEDRPNESFYHRYRVLNQVYLKKPVFHWGALQAKEEIGKLNKTWSQNSLARRKRSLQGDLRAVFLELVVLNYRSQLAREQVKLAKENIKVVGEKEKVGLATSLSLEEAKAENLSREISLAEIQIALQRKISYFITLSGYSASLNLDIPETFWDFCLQHQPRTKFAVLVASMNSEEIEHLHTRVAIEEQNIIISDAELKPKINLTGSYFQDQVDTVEGRQNVDRNNFLVGLEANWAIWDSHKSKAQKKAASARKAKLEHSIQIKMREFRESIDSIIKELASLKERIDLGRKLIAVAQDRLEKSSLELSLKRISPLEHFSSVVGLDLAKIGNLETVCKYMVLMDQYEQAVVSE